jgi:hypothetical protein
MRITKSAPVHHAGEAKPFLYLPTSNGLDGTPKGSMQTFTFHGWLWLKIR